MKTQQLSIDKQHLEAIFSNYGVAKASVFGSFARGEATQDSDLDLLVTFKPGTTLFDAISLQDELEHAFDRKVDIVSEKYLSRRLSKRIRSDIKPLASIL